MFQLSRQLKGVMGVPFSPVDGPLSCMAFQHVTHMDTHMDAWINTSPNTYPTHLFTHTRSSSCCIATQSRLCLTLPDVCSILSGEDGDEFLSCQPAIMVLPAFHLRAGGLKVCLRSDKLQPQKTIQGYYMQSILKQIIPGSYVQFILFCLTICFVDWKFLF